MIRRIRHTPSTVPDLSNDDRVEIKIEDHYYEQSDASVVFRRRDKWTGSTQFVYHGNDGTSFPWNDTAQLNYLSAQVREQVMQTILHVARVLPDHSLRCSDDTRQTAHSSGYGFHFLALAAQFHLGLSRALPRADFDAAIPS